MVLGLHVDEIHDNDSTHVPQAQLTGNLFGRVLVDIEGILLLLLGLGPDAAVDVHDVQRLRCFDDQIRPLLEGDHLPERTLDLAADFEMVEDRLLALVEFHDLLLVGRNKGDVPADFLVLVFVVDVDVREFIVEQVPEDRGGLAVLREELLDVLGFGEICPGSFPFADQRLQLSDQDRRVLAFGCCADDGPVIPGEDAPDKCLKPSFLLLRGDFLGNTHLLGEGEKYNVSSCQ